MRTWNRGAFIKRQKKTKKYRFLNRLKLWWYEKRGVHGLEEGINKKVNNIGRQSKIPRKINV